MFTTLQIDHLERFVQMHLGLPWVEECWELSTGADCWTWLWHCYDAIGVRLPRNVWAARPLFTAVPKPGAPGDVLHMWPKGAPREHLGIKLRGTAFSDCNWGGAGVAVSDLGRDPWRMGLERVWRYVGESP